MPEMGRQREIKRHGLRSAFHGINPINPANRSKFPFVLRAKQMLDLVKYLPREIFTPLAP